MSIGIPQLKGTLALSQERACRNWGAVGGSVNVGLIVTVMLVMLAPFESVTVTFALYVAIVLYV